MASRIFIIGTLVSSLFLVACGGIDVGSRDDMNKEAASQDAVAPECAGLMPAALGAGKRVELGDETCFIGRSDDLIGNVALGHYPFAGGRGFAQTTTWSL